MSVPVNTRCKLRILSLPEVIDDDFKPGEGGEYASGEQGVRKPIKVAPLEDHSVADDQTWMFKPSETEGVFNIIYVHKKPHVPELLSGFTNELDVIPGIPINLSADGEQISAYYVTVRGHTADKQPIVLIQPVAGLIGKPTSDYVGVSKDRELVVERIQMSPGGLGLPGWLVVPEHFE